MSKPADISEEAWNAADSVTSAAPFRDELRLVSFDSAQEGIARAIDAAVERQRGVNERLRDLLTVVGGIALMILGITCIIVWSA